jgi:hypothetical protein
MSQLIVQKIIKYHLFVPNNQDLTKLKKIKEKRKRVNQEGHKITKK